MKYAITAKQRALLEKTSLQFGSHKSFKSGACAMELVSKIAGERWSAHPKCVDSVLSAFFRVLNDHVSSLDRDAAIKPFLLDLIGTQGSGKLSVRRSFMAADWLLRAHLPAWLRAARLPGHADALVALPELAAVSQFPLFVAQMEALTSGLTFSSDNSEGWLLMDPYWRAMAAAAGEVSLYTTNPLASRLGYLLRGALIVAGPMAISAGVNVAETYDFLVQSARYRVDRMVWLTDEA